MTKPPFAVKSDPQLWQKLDMDVARFAGMPAMLTQAYSNIFLSQKNRPARMAYFDGMVENIHTGRIDELLAAKAEGRPVVGTFCVYVPEEIVEAVGGIMATVTCSAAMTLLGFLVSDVLYAVVDPRIAYD